MTDIPEMPHEGTVVLDVDHRYKFHIDDVEGEVGAFIYYVDYESDCWCVTAVYWGDNPNLVDVQRVHLNSLEPLSIVEEIEFGCGHIGGVVDGEWVSS